MRRPFLVFPSLAAFLFAAPSAFAQGFALDTLSPSPAGDRFFTIEGANASGHATLDAMLLGDYARAPLAIRDQSNEDENVGNLISDRLIGHAAASLALWDRLLISIDFPVALASEGTTVSGAPNVPTGAVVGDLRTGLRLRLFGEGPFEAAVSGQVWLPTGDEAELAGDGKVRGRPELALGGRIRGFVWGVNAGVMFRRETTFGEEADPPIRLATMGPQLTFGAAVGGLFSKDRVQVGPELYGASVLSGDGELSKNVTNLEALLGLKFRLGPVVLGGALGTGLVSGVGTPAFRGVASLTYARVEGDKDHDGIKDGLDACPNDAGAPTSDPRTNGCPAGIVIDRDGDGIMDVEDACPDQLGVRADDMAMNGCPDSDGDGALDRVDACPKVPGIANEDPKKNGCPFADKDTDTIEDEFDACPETAGVASQDPKKNGCPSDKDEDGFIDADDACPDIKGFDDPDPKKKGCPRDSDKDSVRDDLDACPRERGPASPDRSKSGCPVLARFTPPRIALLGPVVFKKDADALLPESEGALGDVAAILADHPEVAKLSIDAHTDDKGPKPAKKKLSDKRAAAVVKWLVDHGVAADWLEANGFGGERPIADNKTDEGRLKNQRIEIRLLQVVAPPKPPEPTPPQAPPTPATPEPATPEPADD